MTQTKNALRHKSFGKCDYCNTRHTTSQHRHHGKDSYEAVHKLVDPPSKRYTAWQKAHTKKGKAKTTTKRKTTKRKR